MTSALGDVTPYLVLLVAVATLGPLQFGYHLVRGGCQTTTSVFYVNFGRLR